MSEHNTPAHYVGDGEVSCARALESMMEPINSPKYCMTAQQSYWWGCAFKYLWRYPFKSGLDDLLKLRDCVDRLIEYWEMGQA